MKSAFSVMVLLALIAAAAAFIAISIRPAIDWTFCGVILPIGFSLICFVAQYVTKSLNSKNIEWVYAGFVAAIGSSFGMYILPIFVH